MKIAGWGKSCTMLIERPLWQLAFPKRGMTKSPAFLCLLSFVLGKKMPSLGTWRYRDWTVWALQGSSRKELGMSKGLLLHLNILCGDVGRGRRAQVCQTARSWWDLLSQIISVPLGDCLEPHQQERENLQVTSPPSSLCRDIQWGFDPAENEGKEPLCTVWGLLLPQRLDSHQTVVFLYTVLAGPNHICTVFLVLLSWTWSALQDTYKTTWSCWPVTRREDRL